MLIRFSSCAVQTIWRRPWRNNAIIPSYLGYTQVVMLKMNRVITYYHGLGMTHILLGVKDIFIAQN